MFVGARQAANPHAPEPIGALREIGTLTPSSA